MFEAVHIEGYRAFARLDVSALTRVNVFVGGNNVGKTALLDAIDLLAHREGPLALWRAPERRGEVTYLDGPSTRGPVELLEFKIHGLLHGRALRGGHGFTIEGRGDGLAPRLVASITKAITPGMSLELNAETPGHGVIHTLSSQGHLQEAVARRRDPQSLATADAIAEGVPPTRFVSSHRQSPAELARLWEESLLTSDEELILNAMRLLEPSLERVAYFATETPDGSGFVVKLKGTDGRIPLGSFGDGMHRMLTLALHLVRARGGCLLIDDVDVGLHHTVMVPMWQLVLETARRLDVQVFATTHSSDCISALARLYERDAGARADLAVFRIERGRTDAVRYGAEEVSVATEQDIEVR